VNLGSVAPPPACGLGISGGTPVRRGGTVVRMSKTSPLTSNSNNQALEDWRDAADIAGVRWQIFLEADAESRPWAFARYVAALDAEEAAAAELAALALTDLAA
jgi:hypothetical protein